MHVYSRYDYVLPCYRCLYTEKTEFSVFRFFNEYLTHTTYVQRKDGKKKKKKKKKKEIIAGECQ